MIAEIIAYILVGLGILMAAFGVLGLFRFPVIYMRLLVSSNVDSVGLTLMLTGMMIISPDYLFALKIFIVLVLSLVTSPLAAHAVAASAYESGYRFKE